ncbi:MAG TPA: FHA domain-containing protein [Planctomycetota bacterium]|nr:FHA domain-containing protein [Planctomycetota bacterium]
MTQIILKEQDSTQAFNITKDIITIGRSSKNDIVVRQGELSRFHCQIRKTADGYMIVDLDSRNGIHFNGAKIKEKKLEVGDEILVGKSTIIFEKEIPRAPDSPAPAGPSPAPAPPAGLAADEFVAKGRKNLLSILARTFSIVALIFIVLGYGYIKLQERAGLKVNIISKGASFEQPAQPAMLPNGWLSVSDIKALVTVTGREFQDGKYSLQVEKTKSNGEFCTELYHSSFIKIPAYVKSNPNELYSFGGWIKSDPFKKSLAGYRISWFDDNHRLIRDDYTDFTGGTKDWRNLSSNTRPPAEASYGKFSCLVLGTESLVYFDNVSVLQVNSETPMPVNSKTNKALLNDQSFKLTVFQSGIWELNDAQSVNGLELNGELVFKPSVNMESRQGFYNHSRIMNSDNSNIRVNAQIINPFSLDMFNINIDSSISPTMSITYNFPSDLYTYLRDKYFSLVSTLPAGNIRYLKLISESGVKEISLYDKTVEKVTGINIGFPNNTVAIKYLQPVELAITRDADILYFTQYFQPLTFGSLADAKLAFGLEFELKSMTQSQTDWQQLLRRADDFERSNNLGDAIELYRTIAMEIDKTSDIAPVVEARLNKLDNTAKSTVQNMVDLLYTARLLKDFGLYEKAAKLALDISKAYRKTEYGDRAKTIIQEVKSETDQIKNSDDKQNAEKMLVMANGFAKENQNNLAVWLYEEIIQRYAGTPTAKQAKENLEKIKK